MRRRIGTIVMLIASSAATSALAQADPAAVAHTASANQLGILEYCRSQGDVGDDAISAQKSVIARLPASSAPTDAAEALGREGTIAAPNGSTMTLSSMANTHNTTVSALCQRLGSSSLQSAAAYRQNEIGNGMASMPRLPSMPGMPSIPRMPSMPGMPSMGNMPAIPGTTSSQ